MQIQMTGEELYPYIERHVKCIRYQLESWQKICTLKQLEQISYQLRLTELSCQINEWLTIAWMCQHSPHSMNTITHADAILLKLRFPITEGASD